MDKNLPTNEIFLQKRFIRFRDAASYLGMNQRLFNKLVRKELTEIRIGKRGVAFDRLDLDHWADHYKTCNGRPKAVQPTGEQTWDEKERQASTNVRVSGTLTKRYKESDFVKVVERITLKKRKNT